MNIKQALELSFIVPKRYWSQIHKKAKEKAMTPEEYVMKVWGKK